jgi:hypothetical protein
VQEALWDFDGEGGGDGGGRHGARRPDHGEPGRDPAEPAPGPGRYRRRGLDRCPKCGHPVEVFRSAFGEEFEALLPGEYPSARVPQDAARHLVRGQLWPGRDAGGWSRIRHAAVCPDEAMPEDPELLAMWRTLRVRRRARDEARRP